MRAMDPAPCGHETISRQFMENKTKIPGTLLQFHTDQELLHLLSQGDHQAFEEIYHRYWSPLYGYVYNRFRSRLICQELIQEVFLTLWSKRENAGSIASLSAYLFTGAKYRLLNEMKADRIRKNFAASFTAFRSEEISRVTEEMVAVSDLQEAMDTRISQLPPKCQQIFRLSRHQHQSVADISNALGLSPKTVENQLTKALRILRLGLGEFFLYWLIALFTG